ncbi:MAG: response regulator [Leptolyngbyaceae cyanobacterium CSU_1_4]|nr:response regulator [Leptolyngbyaceae cyanobacterium CSU_1_4]
MVSHSAQPLLVIEDSDEDFAAFERVIRKSSLFQKVYRCTNGDDALDFLRQTGNYTDETNAPRPGMILLDLNLPGTDGREVLEEIKQDAILKVIPVVVFTTSDNPRDVTGCYQCGANGYVVKPIDLKKLTKTVQVIVDYWFEANTPPSLAGDRNGTNSTDRFNRR